METNPAQQVSALAYIMQVLEWLTTGQDRQSMVFNWSSVLQAVDLLRPEELQYLYNLSGTNSTEQMLAVINFSRQQFMHMETLPAMDEFFEYTIREFLQLYLPPIILAIGTLGNILSLVVLRSKPMIGVSSYTYLASLAVTDTVVLYLGLLRIWLMVLTKHDYQAWSDWVCKVSMMFAYTASDLSVWLIIAVTVERYIVVCMPFRANSMCNVSRAKKVIGFLFAIILAINFHFLWTVKVKTYEGKRCMAKEQFVGLVDVAWPWVDAFIYSFLPFIIISVLNILISREVMGAQSKRIQMAPTKCNNGSFSTAHHSTEMQQEQQQQQHRRQTTSNEGTRLTVMLLTVSFTFLLLTLPVNILLIFTYYWNSSQTTEWSLVALKKYVRLQLIKAIIELLMYTNHSINFFLYCATGQKFRRQFLNLIRRCMCCKKHSNSNGFRFRMSTRRISGSYLGGNSEVTSSSRCGHRASSCVSFDMTDCAVRLDCAHSDSNYGDESSPLKDEKHDFANNSKAKHCNLTGSRSNGSLCGGCRGCGGSGNSVSDFHQRYSSLRENGQPHHSRHVSMEMKPMLKDSYCKKQFFSTSSLYEKKKFSSTCLSSSKIQKSNQNLSPKPYKFNCKNVLKKGSCCHLEKASPNCNGHDDPSNKRSFKIYFSSSKKNINTSSLKERLSPNCHYKYSDFYAKGANNHTSSIQMRDSVQQSSSVNTKHGDSGYCV